MLDLRVPRRDDRQALGLRRRIVGARDQLVRLGLNTPARSATVRSPGIRVRRLDVRQRNPRDADPLGELGLGPAELGAVLRDPVSQRFWRIALPTHLADSRCRAL